VYNILEIWTFSELCSFYFQKIPESKNLSYEELLLKRHNNNRDSKHDIFKGRRGELSCATSIEN